MARGGVWWLGMAIVGLGWCGRQGVVWDGKGWCEWQGIVCGG